MQVALTIIRYPGKFIPFAFTAMGVFRMPLSLNRKISFFKLLGCGKNGTFDKVPDLQQWAIITAYDDPPASYENKILFGSFISSWWKLFKCETFTIMLSPLEGHGKWDGRDAFGTLPQITDYAGAIGTLTRATIRPQKLKFFWQNVAPVALKMKNAEGLLFSVGIGEVPWIKQATFTIWKSKEAMRSFAYKMQEHKDVIRKTRQQDWYSEEMFVRFQILKTQGTIRGKDPLQGLL